MLLKLAIVGAVTFVVTTAYGMFQSFQGCYSKERALGKSIVVTALVVFLSWLLFG